MDVDIIKKSFLAMAAPLWASFQNSLLLTFHTCLGHINILIRSAVHSGASCPTLNDRVVVTPIEKISTSVIVKCLKIVFTF